MRADRINTWLTISANVGVIVGLFLVAFELNQNSSLMRIQIEQSRADAAMASNEATYNSEYLPAVLVKIRDDEQLSREEIERYRWWFRAQNRNQDNVYNQYLSGMLGATSPRSVRDFVREVIASSDFGREEWRAQKVGFSDEYVSFVESVLKKADDN